MSVEEQLEQIYSLIKKQAPHLQPKIIPRGYQDSNLQAFCKTEAEKEHLTQLIEQYAKKTNKCSTPTCKSNDELSFTTFWEIDFTKKRYILKSSKFLCKKCKACAELNNFLIQSTDPQTNVAELIQHFAKINKLDPRNVHAVQELYTRAYSIQVVASNMPKLDVCIEAKGKVEPLSQYNLERIMKATVA